MGGGIGRAIQRLRGGGGGGGGNPPPRPPGGGGGGQAPAKSPATPSLKQTFSAAAETRARDAFYGKSGSGASSMSAAVAAASAKIGKRG